MLRPLLFHAHSLMFCYLPYLTTLHLPGTTSRRRPPWPQSRSLRSTRAPAGFCWPFTNAEVRIFGRRRARQRWHVLAPSSNPPLCVPPLPCAYHSFARLGAAFARRRAHPLPHSRATQPSSPPSPCGRCAAQGGRLGSRARQGRCKKAGWRRARPASSPGRWAAEEGARERRLRAPGGQEGREKPDGRGPRWPQF